MRRIETKGIWLFSLLLLLLGPAQAEVITFDHPGEPAGLEVIRQSSKGIELTFRLERVRLEEYTVDGTVYQQVSIPGVFLPVMAGAPNLPGFGRAVALPNGASAHLTVVGTKREKIRGIDVLPAASIPLETDDSPPGYEPDPAIYYHDAYWPEEIVQLSDRKKMRGVDVVSLGISPFQYNPVRKELVVFTEIHVRIDFEGGNDLFGTDRLRSKDWDSILEQHLVNFDVLPELETLETDAKTPEGEYEYVIITVDDPVFIAQAEKLRDFRTEQGISTGVVTLTETGSSSDDIEEWIDHAYNTWQTPLDAVLILGESIWMPFYFYAPDPYVWFEGPTDNDYADVDGDALPDVVVSRIPATSETVELMVDKVIDYETAPPDYAGYFEHPLLSCVWNDNSYSLHCLSSEILHGYLERILQKGPVREYFGGEPGMGAWASPSTMLSMLIDYFGPDGLDYVEETPTYLTDWSGDADGINEAINSGAFMTVFQATSEYVTADLAGLFNEDLTYLFSTSFMDLYLVEAMYEMENGALGGIGNSQYVAGLYVDEILSLGVWDYMWPDFDPGYGLPGPVDPRPAWALASAKYYLQDSIWPISGTPLTAYYYYNTYGDTYTTLYTEIPQELTVESQEFLPIGSTTFDVKADEGATIALSFNGELLGVVEGTGAWQEMAVQPVTEEGEAKLTVTKVNHYRTTSVVPVTESCTYTISPSSVPIQQESSVQVMVWDESGQPAADLTVSIDGYGMEQVNGITGGTGEIFLDVLPVYGEDLVVRGIHDDKSFFCFSGNLPVDGGADFAAASVTAVAPLVDLEGILTPDIEGVLTASSSESEFTFYADGSGIDTQTASGAGTMAELLVVPTGTGKIETVIAKEGFNVYQQSVPVDRLYVPVNGTVMDEQGAPLQGAMVQYYLAGAVPGQDLPYIQSTTGGDGSYSFNSMMVAPYDVYVTLYNYQPFQQAVLVKTSANVIDFTLSTALMGVLSGTVTDVVTGMPVDGTVAIYRSDDLELEATVSTDPTTGYYEIELDHYDYTVVAESVTHLPLEAQVTVDQSAVNQNFALTNSIATVLVVNYADNGNSSATYLVQELNELGAKVVFKHYLDTDPTDLLNYEVVVWSCVNEWTLLEDPEWPENLRNFLAGGGKLLLQGDDLARSATYRMPEEESFYFFRDVLHSDFVSNVADQYSDNLLVVGDHNHPLATTPNVLGDIEATDPVRGIYGDVVAPRTDAHLVIEWSEVTDGSAVLVWDDDRFTDPDHGNLVYMSFHYGLVELEGRKPLLRNAIEYLKNTDRETCRYTISPSSVPIQQESLVQVTMWGEDGQLASNATVVIDGWGINSISGTTDNSGQVMLTLNAPYGENLVVLGQEDGKYYSCLKGELPVTGGVDLGEAAISAEVPFLELAGIWTPGFEGLLTGSALESDFTLYASGCGVDAMGGSHTGTTVELTGTPTEVGLLNTALGKPGFQIFEKTVPVEPVYGSVSGTVVDSQGGAVEGALVEFYRAGADPAAEPPGAINVTDALGGYGFIDPLLVAYWDVYVSKFNYATLQTTVVVKTAANTFDLVLGAPPLAVLSGTVTDMDTGESIDGWVEVYRSDNLEIYETVQTDGSTGYYEIELPYYDYTVVAESTTYFPLEAQVTIDRVSVNQDFALTNSWATVLVVDGAYNLWTYDSPEQFEEDLSELGAKVRYEHYLESDPVGWWSYEVVVWACDDSWQLMEEPEWRDNLRDFLAAGGKLLLEGGDLARYATEDIPEEEWFFSDVLHADYAGESDGYLIVGDSDHVLATIPNVLGDIQPLDLNDGIEGDLVAPRPGAELVMAWSDFLNSSSVLAWDADPVPDWGHGNLVFMSFVYDELDQEDRKQLLENAIVYLNDRGDVAPETGTVSGTALLDGESDHGGITITTDPFSVMATTATDGSYTLSDVSVGTYSVIAAKDGWTDTQVDGVAVVVDQTTGGIDFLLYEITANLPPEAENQRVTTQMNKMVVIELEAEDPNGDPLTYSCVDLPGHGTLSGCDDGDAYVTYIPDYQYTGGDHFSFRANDGVLDSDKATVTVRITKSGSSGGKPRDDLGTLELNPRDLQN